ncbi:hypothetical protein V1514DRAFT_339675, partial [Lipomyces japonicus]|uniref:uncharacterized protein n=1 Tax=Lipomyces japonicus TaxID=56871 RepID=UPI0034CEDF8E
MHSKKMVDTLSIRNGINQVLKKAQALENLLIALVNYSHNSNIILTTSLECKGKELEQYHQPIFDACKELNPKCDTISEQVSWPKAVIHGVNLLMFPETEGM